MKIGITGGNGFISGWVRKELLNRGHSVVVFDRQLKGVLQENEEFFLGDVTDETAVFELAAHVDGIIHLAAVLGTQETIQNPIPSAVTNIIGSLNVFEATTQYKLPCVFAGVGNHFMRLDGTGSYTISKSAAEDYTRMYNKFRGSNIAVVRPVNAYGPGQSVAAPYGSSKVRKIMPSFICRALSGDDLEVYGDGTQISDCVYVGDVARVFVSALEYTNNNGAPSKPLEVGPVESITVNDIANNIISMTGNRSKIVHLPMRPGETPNAVVSANYATLELIEEDANKFMPLDRGIENTIEYYRGYLDNS
jgi:UDP-glucose 4-epimerase